MNIILNGSKQEASTLVVDIVSDLICPWCFIAKRRVEKAAALLHQEIEIRWLPFELNPSMPKDGMERKVYRSGKFGSWAESQRLDAQVANAGVEVGITFRHDRMKRTPNTFRGHMLLAAALKDGVRKQNAVAERLFQAYFIDGEDVGDPFVLLRIARDHDVSNISRLEDFDNQVLADEVRDEELRLSASIRGVPQISFNGKILASGAQREELLASAILDIQSSGDQCSNAVCTNL